MIDIELGVYMSKTIFVSNRLPVTVKKEENTLSFHKSIGGLATGLQGYHEKSDSLWVGWTGLPDEVITDLDYQEIESTLKRHYNCVPINLTEAEIDKYYYGFSNNMIWPLFHYFSNLASHDVENWQAYKMVNQKFYNSIKELIEEDDIIWIHDYQLMLLPQMIREKHPKVKIGFFLHIPFPSYEIFRTIVWREELLEGVLGSDLIGFHTYDYVRHFLSSVRRILGCEHHLNTITYNGRYVKADVFPMGIDFNHFAAEYKDSSFKSQFKAIKSSLKDIKMILSIDRLDYTKGIPERIKAYRRFLELYPEFIGKVRLNLIVAPSREAVDSYKELLKEIQILVSEVNGELGTISWQPIFFFFQSFSQEELIAYYRNADVMLVTPLRDGMNLVVKEYIASRIDYEGMVVISETAGAASELGEYIIVNPNDLDEIAAGIKQALDMPVSEKRIINQTMCKRLKRYNVQFWAEDFMYNLSNLVTDPMQLTGQIDLDQNSKLIAESFSDAENRLLLLDYDGTLVGFKSVPEKAKPDKELKDLIQKLVDNRHNTVVIVSGRDHFTLEKFFGDLNVHLIASHGLWIKHPNTDWEMTLALNNDWKATVNHVLEVYADRMPGALIEEKDFSLAFHYRLCEPDLVATKLNEVKDALVSMTQTMTIGLQEGNKVIEMKDLRVNKGYGASVFLKNPKFDFIMSVGDDVTDEDLFDVLNEGSYGIKVGLGNSKANYRVRSWQSVRKLLNNLSSL